MLAVGRREHQVMWTHARPTKLLGGTAAEVFGLSEAMSPSFYSPDCKRVLVMAPGIFPK